MAVEILSNSTEVNNRKEKLVKEVDDFKSFVAENFSGPELEKINSALDLMLKIHLNQKDRADGQPFAKHPLEVAKKVIEVADNPEVDLVVSALLHDSPEDKPEDLFAERANRKFPNKHHKFTISKEIKEKYLDIFRDWAFKEINHYFGDQVEYYVRNLTNHDFDSLAEDSDLSAEEKLDFKNNAYKQHIKDIIKDPNLCLLKYADFSLNVDLKSLDQESLKYDKLKRKYTSVIPIFIKELKEIESGHPLFKKKEEIVNNLQEVFDKYYSN